MSLFHAFIFLFLLVSALPVILRCSSRLSCSVFSDAYSQANPSQ
jgi:hypothetical protein